MHRFLTILATLALFCAPIAARADDDADLRREIDALKAEVRALRAEVETMRHEGAAPATVSTRDMAGVPTTTATAPAMTATTAPMVETPVAAPAAPAAESTTLWGYGEANYLRPRRDSAATQADLRRAVLGFGHAFSENTRVLGELEWEHAVVSADDEGEAEVEQLFIEHQFRPQLAGRAGLILVPLGLLNERHEPATYYGVERNFVETAIIPSTWREGGVSVVATSANGLSVNAGVTTGFDLSKWDATSEEGRESPLRSIHQELQLAKAKDLSVFTALAWNGLPGLTVGGGAFTGGIGQGQDFAARNARLTLGEAHARWQSGLLDVSGLYARGHISHTESFNLTLVGDPTPVPSDFWGAYAQAAVRVWQRNDAALSPFLRVEEFNTASRYEAVPLGLGIPAGRTERVFTGGVNYWLTSGVVFKADYQKFREARERDRFDLGVGYQF